MYLYFKKKLVCVCVEYYLVRSLTEVKSYSLSLSRLRGDGVNDLENVVWLVSEGAVGDRV